MIREWLVKTQLNGSIPAYIPSVVEPNYSGLSAKSSWDDHVSSVTRLTCNTSRNGKSYIHVCFPVSDPALSHVNRNRAVFMFGGHNDPYYGLMALLFYDLIREGYTLIGVDMPVDSFNATQDFRKLDNTPVVVTNHDFSELEADGAGPLQFFLNGPIVAMNWLRANFNFHDFSWCGISGGGWTGNWCSAIDSRWDRGYAICDSLPFPLRQAQGGPGQNGDWEQLKDRSFWQLVKDYDVVYAMGAGGQRRRIQFLRDNDPVFPVATIHTELDAYQAAIQSAVAGDHEIRIDSGAEVGHIVSDFIRESIVQDLNRF